MLENLKTVDHFLNLQELKNMIQEIQDASIKSENNNLIQIMISENTHFTSLEVAYSSYK
jgi:hypothetical protein